MRLCAVGGLAARVQAEAQHPLAGDDHAHLSRFGHDSGVGIEALAKFYDPPVAELLVHHCSQ